MTVQRRGGRTDYVLLSSTHAL